MAANYVKSAYLQESNLVKICTYGAAVEVVLNTEHEGLVLRDALDLVPPLSGNLDAGLDGFGASVHGQHHVEAKELGDELGELGEHIVVKGTRAQGQARGLVDQDLHQFGMAVSLVHGGIGRQEVQVVTALGIPYGRAQRTRKDDGQRVVVVSGIVMLDGNGGVAGRGVVVGGTVFGGVGILRLDCAGGHDEVVFWPWRLI